MQFLFSAPASHMCFYFLAITHPCNVSHQLGSGKKPHTKINNQSVTGLSSPSRALSPTATQPAEPKQEKGQEHVVVGMGTLPSLLQLTARDQGARTKQLVAASSTDYAFEL